MIRYSELSRHFDARDLPVEAAWAYELALREERIGFDAFANLAVLYFTCMDFGYAAAHKLEMEFVKAAHYRSRTVLDLAERRFGARGEIRFWRHYFDTSELGETYPEDMWLDVARLGDTDLPYIYLAVFVDSAAYRERAANAVGRFTDQNTARARLLRSLMGSKAVELRSD